MSACPQQTFEGITPEIWARLKAKVAADIGGDASAIADAGTESGSGYTVQWSWDPTSLTLTIQMLDSPFWAPCIGIQTAIEDEVAAARAG